MNVATDLEGTLTTGATWRGVASYLRAHGRAREYNRWLALRMPAALLNRAGLINRERFNNAWMDGLMWLFRGTSSQAFEAAAEWVVEEEMWPGRREDVLAEIGGHLSGGQRVIVASGTFEPVARLFSARAGLTEFIATRVEVLDGRLTGKTSGEKCSGIQKAAYLKERLGGGTLDVAYGDTLADVPMLELSNLPVAVYPDARLGKIAQERGWSVVGE